MARPDPSKKRECLIEALETRVLLTGAELVRNGAFEGTVSGSDWVRSGSWQAGLTGFTNYHGGSQYAFYGGTSGATVDNSTGSMYQQIAVPAGYTNPVLTFWSKVTTAETGSSANDTLVASIKNTSGVVVQPLVTLSNVDAVSSSGPYTDAGKYTRYSFPLSPSLIGTTIRVDFSVNTNASLGTTFRIDDVGLREPLPTVAGTSQQVVGYIRDGKSSFFPQLDLDRLTWANYFSVGVSTSGVVSAVPANMDSFITTAHNKGVGVSVTIVSSNLPTVAASASARTTFASSIKSYIQAHNLDGVDIDWEPKPSGSDAVNYGMLIEEVYNQLQPIGKKITAAVFPNGRKDLPSETVKLMNWLNVMCYNFSAPNHATYADTIDGMNGWYNYGVAKDKLVMGVPFYALYLPGNYSTAKTYGNAIEEYKTLYGQYPSKTVNNYLDGSGNNTCFSGVVDMANKMNWARDNGYAGAMMWEPTQDHFTGTAYDDFSLLPVLSSLIHQGDAPTVPDLSDGSDLGSSNTDNFTADNTPTLIGYSWPGAVVSIYDGGVLSGQCTATTSGSWSYTTPALSAGTHSFTAKQSTGGATSVASVARTVTIETTPPVATMTAPTAVLGNPTLDLNVTFTDASGVMGSTIGGTITITGPGGWVGTGTVVSVNDSTNGSPRTGTYRVAARNGAWTPEANGTYSVSLASGAAMDTAGNLTTLSNLGSFSINVPMAAMNGSTLNVGFDGTLTPIGISTNGANIVVSRGGNSQAFSGVSSIVVSGSLNNDIFNFNGPVSQGLVFNGGSGADTLNVNSGTLNFNTDAGNSNSALTVNVGVIGTVLFNATQHLAALHVANNGRAIMIADGSRPLHVTTLSLDAGATLDLNDNDLVINNGNFSNIQSLVWQGYRDSVDPAATGIISTTAQNTLGHPILAVFDNAKLHAADWPWSSGNTVGATAILGQYALLGDADLNGMVTPDDYGAIDSNLGNHVGTLQESGGMSWFAGDWNFDGDITPDDYLTVDANLGVGINNPQPVSQLAANGTVAPPALVSGAQRPGLSLWSSISNERDEELADAAAV
ncbi:MAG TPA: glycosyl hydrolase family 18 protein [Tepidisphaeraceae bacterium]|jgi:hypothetical protein